MTGATGMVDSQGSVLLVEADVQPGQDQAMTLWLETVRPLAQAVQTRIDRFRLEDGRTQLLLLEGPDHDWLRWFADTALPPRSGARCDAYYLGRAHSHFGLPAEELSSAPVLYAVLFPVPVDHLRDFDAWYEGDHAPHVLREPRWLGIRRFHVDSSAPDLFSRLALHYLADKQVLDSSTRRAARQTVWRARMASEPWFRGRYLLAQRA